MAGLPDFDAARIDREKIVTYLLGSSSFASVAKARFFGSLGFSPERWEELAQALRALRPKRRRRTASSLSPGPIRRASCEVTPRP